MKFLSIAEIIEILLQPNCPDCLPKRRPTLKKWLDENHVINQIRYGGNFTAEYALGGLPQPFQHYLCPPLRPEDLEPLSVVDAKIGILAEFDDFVRSTGKPIWQAATEFERMFNQGLICTQQSIRATIAKVSDSSVIRWLKKIQENGADALKGAYYWQRQRAVEKDPEILEVCRGLIGNPPRTIYRFLQDVFPDKKLPSPASIARWSAAVKITEPTLFWSIVNPTVYRNSYQIACGNASEGIDRLNQRWEIDGTRADLLVDGSKVNIFEIAGKRYTLLSAVEVFSRRAIISVVEVNSAENVVNLFLRRAFQIWGIPEQIRIDCGREFLNKRLQGMCLGMGIELKACIPGKPEQKPHVERMFRTLREGLLQRLPGYCGYNPAMRKMLESANDGPIQPILTPQDLQDQIDRWLANNYEQRNHGTLGTTPMQQWLSSPVAPKFITDERQLDILLLPTGSARVGKEGIYFKGTHYVDRTGQWEAWRGQRVAIRLDAGKAQIYCFNEAPAGEFLFVAVDPALAGLPNVEMVVAARQHEKARVTNARKVYRRARKKVEGILRRRPAQPDSTESPNVVPFQRQEEAPVSIEIQAALHEIDRLVNPPVAAPAAPQIVAHRAAVVAPAEPIPLSSAERYQSLRSKAPADLSESEQEFLTRYESIVLSNRKSLG
jgi:putative transposase